MNKAKSIIGIFLTFLLLNACGSVVQSLGGSKKKGSDEFLVEKKAALVLPPSFGELPEPGTKIDENLSSNKEDTSNIEEIINQSPSTDTSKENKDINDSVDQYIIEKINEQ